MNMDHDCLWHLKAEEINNIVFRENHILFVWRLSTNRMCLSVHVLDQPGARGMPFLFEEGYTSFMVLEFGCKGTEES